MELTLILGGSLGLTAIGLVVLVAAIYVAVTKP